jgi:hypothetical protein
MPRISTAGTASCAMISIGHFKSSTVEANEKYKKDKLFTPPKDELSAKGFYDKILYPTKQELGWTYNMPFERLMEELDNSSLKSKYVLVTLNHSQFFGNNQYWPKELRRHGFTLFEKTNNSIGGLNYMFSRNPQKVGLTKEELSINEWKPE